MAVTYKNVWKNVLVALKSKIRAEMKCPVFSNWDETNKSNQFIRLVPTKPAPPVTNALIVYSKTYSNDQDNVPLSILLPIYL